MNGDAFTGLGYLIAVNGLDSTDLFSGAPGVDTALLTMYAAGTLTSRVLDTSVHSLDIVGTLDVYQRRSAGASFADPASFQNGSRVARFEMDLQDVLAVFAPGKGIPTMSGDMRQLESRPCRTAAGLRPFGRPGLRLRLLATGLGTLVDPVTLNADLEMAGNWAAV